MPSTTLPEQRPVSIAGGARGAVVDWRWEPRSLRAASRVEASKLARAVGVLPDQVRWLYLQALRSEVRRDESSLLHATEHPLELARLLELGGDAQNVVGFGRGSVLGGIALAVVDPTRVVTIFEPLAEAGQLDHYLRWVDRDVRARVDFRVDTGVGFADAVGVPDLVLVDASNGFVSGLAQHWGARILEGAVDAGSFLWRPVQAPTASVAEPNEGAWQRFRLPALGLVVGVTVALSLPPSLTNSGPGMSGSARRVTPPALSEDGVEHASSPRKRAAASARPAGEGHSLAVRAHGNSRSPSATSEATLETPVNGGKAMRPGLFSGSGDRLLGTLRIDKPMLLAWASRERSFTVHSEHWSFQSNETDGTTVLTPGTYREFRVTTSGYWTLRVTTPL